MKQIGKYKIVKVIGRGAFGIVYKAIDTDLDRSVAIKIVTKEHIQKQEIIDRFVQEGRIISNIQDDNIVTIFESGVHEERPYIVMELMEGTDLTSLIQLNGRLSISAKIDIIKQVAQGLYHAHKKGIIHRDIKPGNIRLLGNGRAKIMDFGIARIPTSDMTRTNAFMGTPYYMSPEQIAGIRKIDERSDLFSLGVVFYELLTNQKPFQGENALTILHKIMHQPAPAIDIPIDDQYKSLKRIIFRLLEKDPRDRFQNARELAETLSHLLPARPEHGADNLDRDISVIIQEIRDSTERDDITKTRISPSTSSAGESVHTSTRIAEGSRQSNGMSQPARGEAGYGQLIRSPLKQARNFLAYDGRDRNIFLRSSLAILIFIILVLVGSTVLERLHVPPGIRELMISARNKSQAIETYPEAIIAYKEVISKAANLPGESSDGLDRLVKRAEGEVDRLERAYFSSEIHEQTLFRIENAHLCEEEGVLDDLEQAIVIMNEVKGNAYLGDELDEEVEGYLLHLVARREDAVYFVDKAHKLFNQGEYSRALRIADKVTRDFSNDCKVRDFVLVCHKKLAIVVQQENIGQLFAQAEALNDPGAAITAISNLESSMIYPSLSADDRSRLDSLKAAFKQSFMATVEQRIQRAECDEASNLLQIPEDLVQDDCDLDDWMGVKKREIQKCYRTQELLQIERQAEADGSFADLVNCMENLKEFMGRDPSNHKAAELMKALTSRLLSKGEEALKNDEIAYIESFIDWIKENGVSIRNADSVLKSSAQMLSAKSKIALNQGDLHRAEKYARWARKADPDKEKYGAFHQSVESKILVKAAEELYDDGSLLQAVEVLGQAEEKDRGNGAIGKRRSLIENEIRDAAKLIEESREQMKKNNYLKAAKKAIRAHRILPSDENVKSLMDSCEPMLIEEAQRNLDNVRARLSSKGNGETNGSWNKVFQGSSECLPPELEQAVTCLKIVHEYKPKNHQALSILHHIVNIVVEKGEQELHSNSTGKARICAKKAIELAPGYEKAWLFQEKLEQ
ncbi:serine/threonine protein kinase [Acidobacteriota bacterium]